MCVRVGTGKRSAQCRQHLRRVLKKGLSLETYMAQPQGSASPDRPSPKQADLAWLEQAARDGHICLKYLDEVGCSHSNKIAPHRYFPN